MFNFIDSNNDCRLSYLEFRSWMLLIDRTLAEHELLGIFNEMDRNGTVAELMHRSLASSVSFQLMASFSTKNFETTSVMIFLPVKRIQSS